MNRADQLDGGIPLLELGNVKTLKKEGKSMFALRFTDSILVVPEFQCSILHLKIIAQHHICFGPYGNFFFR